MRFRDPPHDTPVVGRQSLAAILCRSPRSGTREIMALGRIRLQGLLFPEDL